MTRMILHSRQILDERRHARQGPEVGLVTLHAGTLQQRLGDPLSLLGCQLGFAASRALAGQPCSMTIIPHLVNNKRHCSISTCAR